MPGPSFRHCRFNDHCLFAAVKNDASKLSHHAVTAQWHNPNYTAASSDAPLLGTLPLTCNNVIKYGKFIARENGRGIRELKPYGGSGNTYADGTAINASTVAITKDRALGAATGALVFTGGNLRFDSSFGLASTCAVTANGAGATFDTNGEIDFCFTKCNWQRILNKSGAGSVSLEGAHSFAGNGFVRGRHL